MILRKNYDKPWRCPVWSGPAFKGPVGECPSGSLGADMFDPKSWQWHFHRCPKCGALTLPYVVRLIEPPMWLFYLKRKWSDWQYNRRFR